MTGMGIFVSSILIIDTFFVSFAIGFNSRSVPVVDAKLPAYVAPPTPKTAEPPAGDSHKLKEKDRKDLSAGKTEAGAKKDQSKKSEGKKSQHDKGSHDKDKSVKDKSAKDKSEKAKPEKGKLEKSKPEKARSELVKPQSSKSVKTGAD